MPDGERYVIVASTDVGRIDSDPAMILVGPYWSGEHAERRRRVLERALKRAFPEDNVVVTVEWLHADQSGASVVEQMTEERWMVDAREEMGLHA